MAHHKQLFSYDTEEYADVHEWIQNFTAKGEKSRQIRMALRAYINAQKEGDGSIKTVQAPSPSNEKNTRTDNQDDSYVDPPNDLFNL